jgi:hypothetical protein
MQALRSVLMAKILITVFLWCVPLLLLPEKLLSDWNFKVPQPDVFLRLLGAAYLALAIGYIAAWRAASRDIYPQSTVWVGIVSNGGAFIVMLLKRGDWQSWEGFPSLFMWGSMAAAGLITLGLIVFGPLRAAHYQAARAR